MTVTRAGTDETDGIERSGGRGEPQAAEGERPSTGKERSDRERPERPPASAMLSALSVPKHAKRGAIAGLLLATAAYLVRVLELLGPPAGGREYPILGPEGWFLVLAFVLAVTSAMLITMLLVALEAVRTARNV